MRAVVQRVKHASVEVDGALIGAVGRGVLVFLGVRTGDVDADAGWLAGRVAHLRIFEDDQGKMNRSLLDVGGEALVVSQFTLYGDCSKGRRPSFVKACEPSEAERLYERFCIALRAEGVPVATGRFRADMAVSLLNDGPVTLLVDSERTF